MSTTIEQILDIEGNTEDVFFSILDDLGIPAYASDSNVDLPIPRVDVVATLESSGPHEFKLTGGAYAGQLVYDQHNVSVSIRYTYAPDNPGQASPRLFRGTMRRLMFFPSLISDKFTDQALYRVAGDSIRGQSGIRQVESDEEAVTLEATIPLVLFIASPDFP